MKFGHVFSRVRGEGTTALFYDLYASQVHLLVTLLFIVLLVLAHGKHLLMIDNIGSWLLRY
jgi:hypothetical protein